MAKIHDYSTNGQLSAVQSELEASVPVDIKDDNGFTPLACAVGSPLADVALVKLLIDADADIHATFGRSQRTLLDLATKSASVEKINLLLKAGVNINRATNHGYTALVNAIYALYDDGRLPEIISHLVQNGANVDCETTYGESPITVASRFGRFDCVQALLNADADLARLRWTPLMTAICLSDVPSVEQALRQSSTLSGRDRFDRTAWLLSAVVGYIEKAALLLNAGANLEESDHSGETALMIAAMYNHAGLAEWLIGQGADLEATDKMGSTPLLHAVQRSSIATINVLLKSGANLSHRNSHGEKSVSQASSVEVVKLLVEAGESFVETSTEMRRKLTRLESSKAIEASVEEYHADCRPRFGRSNPELIESKFCRAMVRAGWGLPSEKAVQRYRVPAASRVVLQPIWHFFQSTSRWTVCANRR